MKEEHNVAFIVVIVLSKYKKDRD